MEEEEPQKGLPTDKKRKLSEDSPGNSPSPGQEGDEPDQRSQSRSASPSPTTSHKKKKYKFFDDEAAEDSDDKGASGSDSDGDGDEEDDNSYVIDDFVVRESDSPKTRKIKKKREKRARLQRGQGKDSVNLDEEDLDLIRANLQSNKDQQTALRNRDADDSEGELSGEGEEVEIKPGNVGYDEEDEMRDFIEDDYEDDDVPDRKLAMPVRKTARQSKKLGPTDDQIKEAIDIFGDGYEDFDDEDDADGSRAPSDNEDENNSQRRLMTTQDASNYRRLLSSNDRKSIAKLRSKYEWSQIVANFCTDKDEDIRRKDIPERMQKLAAERISLGDNEDEVIWITEKIVEKLPDPHHSHRFDQSYLNEIAKCVSSVLLFIQVENLEVPFIWAYRRDYLHPEVDCDLLWYIYDLDQKWEALRKQRERLLQEIETIRDAAEGISDDDDNLIEQLTNELSEHEYHTVKQQYQSAITDEKAFMDIIDEREEVTLEDRENVARATAMKEALQGELRILEQKYLEGMAILETSKIRMQRKERYDKEAAKDVLTYFSSDRYVDLVRSSTTEEQLKGITQFLGCFVRGFNALKKNNADELSGASESEMKKAVRKDEYSKYRRIRSLQRFISNVCVPISDFGDALRYNRKLEPPPTPSFYCRDMADEFVDYEQFKNVDQVLHAAKLVIATELSMEPYIREKSRKLYRERASISTRPTPKGVATINPFHDLFGLHYLNRKPLVDFLYGADLTMFVKLTEAQGNGLITITIHPPEVKQVGTDDRVTDIQLFLQTGMPLVEQFFPSLPISEDRHAMFRPSWDALRLEVLQTCIETILLPSLEVECRRELLSTARNALIKEVANNFATYLKIGPYNMDIADRDSSEMYRKLLLSCPKRSNYPTVGVVYLQPDADSIMSYVYLNKDGVMRTHDSLPKKAANQRQSRLKKNLLETRPNLIIINASGGQQAKALSITIAKQLIPTISAELAQSSRYVGDLDEEDEDQGINYQPQVVLVSDEIAKIFQHSPRTKKVCADLDAGCAAALCLGRYAQEPLAEVCNLWTSASSAELFGYEALFLKLHPLQHTLKGMESTVVNALERKLVDAVSEVGVDINKAVTFDHLSSMLAFIPGLGLRKGEALKQAVQRKLGTVESRRSLFDKKVLAECVWKNAAGFLKITSGTVDKQLDPLDNTRIHPECYITHDFAPKICADALEVDNIPTDYFAVVETVMKRVKKTLEIRMEKHPRWIDLWENGRPIPGVTRYTETFRSKDGREHSVGIELDDILCELELGEYANDLENVYRLGKRRVQLEQIKDELRFPWLDLRKPLQQITNEQMFEILTGETNQSLYVSLKMGFTVINIDDSGITDRATNEFVRRQKAVVKTDTGLRGYVSMFDVLEDKINPETFNIADHLQIGSHYLGVVVGVNKNRTSVDLSVKPSYLKATEAWWIERRTKESYCRKWLESCGRNPYELFDRFFNEAEALRKFSDYENELIKSSNGMNDSLASVTIGNGGSSNGPRSSGAKAGETIISRLFHHPLFANVNNKGAVEKFQREGKGTGSVIIRPSSKGANYLTITWAFQEGWYKHISVLEKGNKRSGNVGLGDELWVMEDDIKEPFSDLDEIYSRYIEPMNEFVALIVKHKVFRRGTEQLVVEAMKEQINENRERIPYFIRFDEHAAGCFILTWMNLNPNSHNPVKRELIKVRPYGYLFRKQRFRTPSEIINNFKEQLMKAAEPVKRKSRFDALATKSPPLPPSMPYPRARGGF